MSEEEAQLEVDNEELTKEERLEAARKKYEELKKKKKKKKKGKKKDEKDENDGDADKPEDNEVASEGEEKQVKEEEKEETTETVVESESKETETQAEPKHEESPQLPIEVTGQNTPESIITPSEINELKQTITQHENTIKKLRDENTDLKLSQMDMKDKITELESVIQQLKAGASSVASPVPSEFPIKKLEPAKQLITKNEYSSEVQDFSETRTDDFREKLLLWKNWQVDMTYWNSTYQTEKITL